MHHDNKIKIPAIICDIDGVLLLSKTPIPKVKETISLINK